jgi:hypothetical protein
VDVFSSYRRRAAADPGAAWAARTTPTAFCDAYRTSFGRVRRWTRSHRNLAMVRYEAFTTDPGETFAELCGFLGEPFDPAAIEEPDPDYGRWRGDPHLWAEIVTSTKDWRDHMTSDEAALVQDHLADVMDELGYEAYPTG